MATSKAISLSQFFVKFCSAWKGTRGKFGFDQKNAKDGCLPLPSKLGLAVSGGADSMALAYLCRQLEKSELAGPISVTAFVVDHCARPESHHEAQTVVGWLTNMGIKTKVLHLDWSPFSTDQNIPHQDNTGLTPLPSAFETHARRLRFQALGEACRECDIEALLMGHHRDDTVETTIWRLSSGARGAGLAGIPGIARIPECHGLFGVSESGSSMKLTRKKSYYPQALVRLDEKNQGSIHFTSNENENPLGSMSSSGSQSRQVSKGVSIATGGVLLCRPLLAFPKAMLLETCHQNKVPYVSDPTNFDPTLTPRNAIRSMLASNSLPQALRAPSIISLVHASRSHLESTAQLSNQMLSSRFRILDLNLETGTMVLQILEAPTVPDLLQGLSTDHTLYTQCHALRRLTEIICASPGTSISLNRFEPFTSRVFEQQDDGSKISQGQARKSFTLGGVMFNPLSTISTGTCHTSPSGGNNIWLLSRQPFWKNKSPALRFDVPVSNFALPNSSPASTSFGTSTPWKLWDDRYWFRFTLTLINKDAQRKPAGQTANVPFVIRPFQKSDITKIRNSPRSMAIQDGEQRAKKTAVMLTQLRKLLSSAAPGSTRYTVPVLTVVEESDGLKQSVCLHGDHLLALPTLDFCLDAQSKQTGTNEMKFPYGEEEYKVAWEWMYKMVDTEALRFMRAPVEAGSAIVHNNSLDK
ncbi:hypothetical protein N7462_004664 [Penicillium macrosclerotiorum]|uniref:uncharacterized protein n=1 Tax=Penicillium macrosclerotiorum TaxID=303699 RepID=UPI00254909CE|nr:uncharacterized protein N7462_004664 [Penicillium macrosclerotiorum]KAJ5690272.1 hypothetical protein N7462_004664 [Penicillium macrosclerotiorum]